MRPTDLPSDAPLKDRILNYIQRTDYVSFAELNNRFPEARVRGEHAVTLPNRPNSIMWAGMSDEFCTAIIDLLQAREIFPQTSSFMVYAIDGGSLSYPVGKRIGKADYKTPHWIIVTLRPAEAVRGQKIREMAI